MVVAVVGREMCLELEGCPCCRSGPFVWKQMTGWEVEKALESSW